MHPETKTTPRLGEAREVLIEAVRQRQIPGAVALVRWRGEIILYEAFGCASVVPACRSMTLDTVFDLASLTKPLATTPVVLSMVGSGSIELDAPVAAYLPELRHFELGSATIRQLLSHTSGLSDWEPVYVWTRSRTEAARAIGQIGLSHPPGSRVEYSCLGFILLGLAVERVAGAWLDEVVRTEVTGPLGLDDTGYGFRAQRCAWTERGNEFEREKVRERNLSFDGWRSDFYPGQVHDGNAWYVMEGVSGNAGLFATAHDVDSLGSIWRDGGSALLPGELVTLAIADATEELDEGRGLGWQINRPPVPHDGEPEPRSTGTLLSPRAFGHTGFTGTSIWIDAELDLSAVLLTNRVHPVADPATNITVVRGHFHDAVARAVRDAAMDEPLHLA